METCLIYCNCNLYYLFYYMFWPTLMQLCQFASHIWFSWSQLAYHIFLIFLSVNNSWLPSRWTPFFFQIKRRAQAPDVMLTSHINISGFFYHPGLLNKMVSLLVFLFVFLCQHFIFFHSHEMTQNLYPNGKVLHW